MTTLVIRSESSQMLVTSAPCYWTAVDPAAWALRAGLEEETLSPGWVLGIRKSNSTGWRVAVNHCEPERLNSIVSGKPAAATRMRFLPFASTTDSTTIPNGYLISRYTLGHPPWVKPSMWVNYLLFKYCLSLWAGSPGAARYNWIGWGQRYDGMTGAEAAQRDQNTGPTSRACCPNSQPVVAWVFSARVNSALRMKATPKDGYGQT